MNKLSRMTSEVALGLGIGIGINETNAFPDANPAHVALIHAGEEAATPAPPEQTQIHMNREERRFLGITGDSYVAKDSPAFTDLTEKLQSARVCIDARRRLSHQDRD